MKSAGESDGAKGVFARTLVRLRQDAGFKTPYAYYHRNGGRRVFPFTFAYYLKLERGKHLPRPEWLPIMLAILRIPPTDEAYHGFVSDFLKDLFVTEENYRSLVAPLLRDKAGGDPEQRAKKRLITNNAYHVTEAQCKVLLSDPAAYWAFECLVNDYGSLDAEELAKITGLPVPALKNGLAKLVKLGLAKKTAAERFKSPLAGRFYVLPMGFPGYEEARRRMAGVFDGMIAKRGAVLHESGVILRADEASMRRAISAFRGACESTAAYSVHDKVEGGGLFLIQTRLRKVFDF